MTLASSNIRLCLALALFLFSNGQAEELLQPPKSMVRYKLSNLQTRDSVLGTGFSFDYRRTQEGEGVPRLVVRTNHGESRVLGLQIQIEDSGTIRLRDLTGRSTWLLDMHDDEGIAFYFVVDPIPGIRGKQQYLVSNVVKNKAFNLKVKGRRLTEEEKAEFERQQLAKLPPKSVPEGFLRVVAETKLLPGTQVKFGVMGEWKDAEIVDFPSANTVRILEKDASQVRLMVRNEWLAISEQTAAKIKSDPEQFISRIQTLPKSNLVLKQGIVPIPTPVDLLPGTPLLRDHYGRWQDVYFLSCDNVSVRVLSKENGQSKVEFVPISVLAVRAQSLRDQKDEKIKLAYAANVADAETIGTEVKLGTSGTSSMAGGGFAGAITNLPKTIKKPKATQGEEAKNPFETSEMRQWVDRSGKFKIEASFIEQKGTDVFLSRADKKTISVPVDMLSEADQGYLKKLAEAAANPFNNIVDQPKMNADEQTQSATSSELSDPSKFNFSQLLRPKLQVTEINWGAKSVAISPGGELLLIGRNAASASLVDIETGKTLVDSERMEHLGNIGVCGFSPDGKMLVIGGYKGVFEVYNVDAKGLELAGRHTLHNREISSFTFSLDGKYILSGDVEKTARYWDVSTGQSLATMQGFEGKIKATYISPTGDKLFATDGKTLQIVSAQNAEVISSIDVARSHASGQAAAFSPDGKLLAVGDSYNVDIWDIQNFRKLGTLEGNEINWSMVFAPNSRHLLSGGNGVIHVWDCETLQKIQTNAIGKHFYVQALAISDDGRLVSAPSGHREVGVFEVQE